MSIKIANDTANGSATLQPSNTATGDVVHTLPAFSTELSPRMQLMTAQNSTSGTSIDFTGIPSWAKKITVMFNGVSTSGTSVVQVQLGSTVIQNTGYSTMAGYGSSAGQYSTLTTGFPIDGTNSATASNNRFGLLLLCNLTTNVWCETTNIYSSGVTNNFGSGCVTLSGTLDRIRITTVNGTDTFDAGQINVLYEG